ncbi:MAG: glycosyltransferase [Rudaea sp.]|uniref:glycosyltransferase n=1 Tax=Rudaea sp. TaxID=2136325 RepID=UPI0039E23C79
MHALITCVGSAGDVHPFLAIGRALQARGHRVELLTSPYFRPRVVAAGLDFVPIGTDADYEEGAANPDLWHPRRGFAVAMNLVLRRLREGYERILERLAPDTVLIGSTLAWSSRCVQEKTGTPGATVHLAPSLMFSAIDPPRWPGMAWFRHMPAWCVRAAQRFVEKYGIDPPILPGLNAFRAQIGLPPVRRVVSDWENSPDLVIGAFPDWFAAPQADWPAHSVTTGFPRWNANDGTRLDPALETFLQAGPSPLGLTPGSAMAHGRPLFERALAACETLGLRAVLVTPYRDQLPATLPDFAHHARYVPFDLLLPRLCGFVHHGGCAMPACRRVAADHAVRARPARQRGAGVRTWRRRVHRADGASVCVDAHLAPVA